MSHDHPCVQVYVPSSFSNSKLLGELCAGPLNEGLERGQLTGTTVCFILLTLVDDLQCGVALDLRDTGHAWYKSILNYYPKEC